MATTSFAADELTIEQVLAVKAKLVDTDGEPRESAWHRAAINLLIECLYWHCRPRTDFYLGGNMFIYYSMGQLPPSKKKYRGSDFFLVKEVDGTRERLFWWVFEENGKYPNVIIELASPNTADEDRTTKKTLYEQVFQTPEYFLYDPTTEKLDGWRLRHAVYHKIKPTKRGWMWSEEMQLWLGTAKGSYQGTNTTWLRLFDAAEKILPTPEETAKELAAENARLKALLKNSKRSSV